MRDLIANMGKQMDFYGEFDDLKALVASQGYDGDWVEKNDNLIQFRVTDQVVIKWRPLNNGPDNSRLGVQGPYRAAEPVLRAIRGLLGREIFGPKLLNSRIETLML